MRFLTSLASGSLRAPGRLLTSLASGSLRAPKRLLTSLASGSLRAPGRLPGARRAERGEEGVVLLLLLAIFAFTIGSVYAFARTATLDILSSGQRVDRGRAALLARSGVDLAVRAIVDDVARTDDPIARQVESGRDAWAVLSRSPIEVEGGELRIEVSDRGTRIPVNTLVTNTGDRNPRGEEFFKVALDRIIEDLPPGPTGARFYEKEDIQEAIFDWMDADTATKNGDDEVEFYRDRGAQGVPPNRPVWVMGELAGIPGMDDVLLTALSAYFQPALPGVLEERLGVNPNTAPPHVLALLVLFSGENADPVDEDDVFRVLKARKEGKVFCPSGDAGQANEDVCANIGESLGEAGVTTFPEMVYTSNLFEIRSRGRIGDTRACVTAVVDRSEAGPPALVSYRLGC
jgi:type II secretory pathway component PulK